MTFNEMVDAELARARDKFPEPAHIPHNWTRGMIAHYFYAVIKEELDEVWELVKSQHGSTDEMISELVQVAAMCRRFAELIDMGVDIKC